VLYNEGIIPATVRLEGNSSKSFTVPNLEKSIVIRSKQKYSFDITFHPVEVKQHSMELRLKIQNNNFEHTVITVVGDGYTSEVVVDLPGEQEELHFGECPVGVTKELNICMRNQSVAPIRFDWKPHPEFTFVPSLGHLQVSFLFPIL
jgi:hypothetical protein